MKPSSSETIKILFIGPLLKKPNDAVRAAQKAALCAEVAHEVCARLEEKLDTKVVSKIVTDYPVHVLSAGHDWSCVINETYRGAHPKRTALKRLTDALLPKLNESCNVTMIVDFSGQDKGTLDSLAYVIMCLDFAQAMPQIIRVGSALPEADHPLPKDWIERRKEISAQRGDGAHNVPCPIASIISERILAAAQPAA